MDNTTSSTIVTAEVIASQPSDGIARTVGLTAGVTDSRDPAGGNTSNGGISFRGGRAGVGEVKYLIDGVDVSNPMSTVTLGFNPGQGDADMATDLPEASMEEVQVITGGLDARYDAKSAVVNIVSRGTGANFSGYIRTKMTPSEYGNGGLLGYDVFQPSGYKSFDWFTEEAKKVGTGGRDINEQEFAPPSKVFNNPRFRRYEFGFGGPISLASVGVGGSMAFNINGDIFDTGGFYRGQSMNRETWNFRLVYNTASNSSWTFSYLNSHQESREYTHSYSRIVSTGDMLYGYIAGSDTPDSVMVGSIVHPDGTLESVQNYDMLNNTTRPVENSNMLALSYKKTVSSKTFFELSASRFYTEQTRRDYDPATGRPLGLEDYRTLRFSNPADSRFFPEGAPTATKLETYWWINPMQCIRQRQDDRQAVWTFKGDLVSQLNEYNELRVGLEYKTYDLYLSYQRFASGDNEYTNFIDVEPQRFAAYAEDKIETDGMIINFGLRFEYFDPNAILPEDFADPLREEARDRNSPLYDNPESSAEDRIKNPRSADKQYHLSPRIGISFPITANDVFHINYGHYFGMPPLGVVYDNYSWALLGAYKYMGNPNVQNEKIISYEAGVEHGFSDDVKLVVTGFYKDIADLINFRKFIDAESGSPYWVTVNADYANVKGFELSLQTRRWYNAIMQVAYTWSYAKGKTSDSYQAFQDDYDSRLPRTEDFFLDWDVRHTLSANFDYRIPEGFFGNQLIDDWGVNFILTYNSGRPYTSANTVPPPNQPAINDKRYPSWMNVDMRLFKNFSVWKSIKLGVFFEVFNLFNERPIRTIDNEEKYDLGFDEGDGTQNRPDRWATPMETRLGFELLF
jgi:outer membrane receptor for ferrienterochelin and colicin